MAHSTIVPSTYDEVYRVYYPYVRKIIFKWGVRDDYLLDELSSVMLTKFIERDMLSAYDPERNVLFSTFLAGFIGHYIRYHIERANLHRDREGTSLDAMLFDNEDSDLTVYDVVIPAHYDDYGHLEFAEFVRHVRSRLATLAPLDKRDRCSMPALFEEVLRQEFMEGRINIKELTEIFGAGDSTVRVWVTRLRAHISTIRQDFYAEAA